MVMQVAETVGSGGGVVGGGGEQSMDAEAVPAQQDTAEATQPATSL